MKYVITDKLNAVNAMCTAEQRILPMCATEKGIEIDFLMDLNQANNQKIATHIWGYKRTLKYSYLERKKYCKACIDRIHNDFPEYEKLVMENKIFQHYL
jgi:hypothetical protein